MALLFVNACPRGEASRTLMLARALLQKVEESVPGLRVVEHDLVSMGLKPSDAAWLAEKDALCDRLDWTHERLRAAVEFQRAEAVLVAAPYWDLSFPAVLKVWVENIWVRNLTFVYQDDRPVGLARGKAAVYVTTSGAFLAGHDWGRSYIQDVMHTLGIGAFRSVCAEGLDLDRSDPRAILDAAKRDAEACADWLAVMLRGL